MDLGPIALKCEIDPDPYSQSGGGDYVVSHEYWKILKIALNFRKEDLYFNPCLDQAQSKRELDH